MIETGFTYLRNMLAKVEVTIKDKTKITNSILNECITAKQFNRKMVDYPISMLFRFVICRPGLALAQ